MPMCFKEKQKELRLDRGRKARGIAARGVPVHVGHGFCKACFQGAHSLAFCVHCLRTLVVLLVLKIFLSRAITFSPPSRRRPAISVSSKVGRREEPQSDQAFSLNGWLSRQDKEHTSVCFLQCFWEILPNVLHHVLKQIFKRRRRKKPQGEVTNSVENFCL